MAKMIPHSLGYTDSTIEWSTNRSENNDDAIRWAALIIRDQADRWRSGHRRSVEDYLTAYPQLARHPNLALTLAATEFLIRADLGELPHLNEYLRRFPFWANCLESDTQPS